MKAKSLMIGDWVMYRNQPRQVVYIYCRPLADGTNHANEIGFTYDEDEWVNADHVEPIPLTAEILEKNGFGSENILGDRSSVPFLMQVYDENHIVMYQKLFDYVHELQQALRLCRTDEIANNFKVE